MSARRAVDKGAAPPKSHLGGLLQQAAAGGGGQRRPTLVPPILKQVGRLAAGVASVGAEPPRGGEAATGTGSATGNPRNKVALQPGHSLMDWIRLGNSGKDLSGVGADAGRLSVTKRELSRHNVPDDAWTAIRGKVYNVTAYLPFHPGGPDELMRAAGTDATRLFDQVHPWVNYDQILQRCLVGRLVVASVEPELLFGEEEEEDEEREEPDEPGPRFDWIQKSDSITLIFYTGALSNPFVEVYPLRDDGVLRISMTYDGRRHDNELALESGVRWPPTRVGVALESGKVECSLGKLEPRVWERFGALRRRRRRRRVEGVATPQQREHVVLSNERVARDVHLLELEPVDGRRIVRPVGSHVKVSVRVEGEELSRSYTPLPSRLFDGRRPPSSPGDSSVRLMVKRYAAGSVSRPLTDRRPGESVLVSGPFGDLELSSLDRRDTFVMLAAGTGFTPMAGVLAFLLERRMRRCQFVRLLFFNRTEQDIPFREQLDRLSDEDNRFRVEHVLSEPDRSWTGATGHVSRSLVRRCVDEQLAGTGYSIGDVYFFVCGPAQFVATALDELRAIDVSDAQAHVFGG